MLSQYAVKLVHDEDTKELRVVFFGPEESPYEGVGTYFIYYFLSAIIANSLYWVLI